MKYGRRDKNHRPILDALQKLPDVSVEDTADIGRGFPDAIVGYKGSNWFIEIKNPEQPPSKRRLTPAEERWHQEWKGQVAIVHGYPEVLELIGYPVLL